MWLLADMLMVVLNAITDIHSLQIVVFVLLRDEYRHLGSVIVLEVPGEEYGNDENVNRNAYAGFNFI